MLAAVPTAVKAVNGREVVIAIVGGTMLTLALTRPRLTWMERLTKDSDSARKWAERALTLFSLVMAGYAATTLLDVLHKQLGAETDSLLEGAGMFLAVYAWLVHFEPFVREWRLRGGAGATILYTAVLSAAVLMGGLLTEVALQPSFSLLYPEVIVLAVMLIALGWVGYRLAPDFRTPLDDLLDKVAQRRTRQSSDSSGGE